MYHHFCIDKKEAMNEAISQFTRAESLLQIGLCRSILGELRQFSFQDTDITESWIGFCEATIARLGYSWSTAAVKFEKYIANSSSLQIRAYLLDGLSRTLREYGDWKTAEITSRKAGEAFEQLGDQKAKLTALLILGNLLARQHRWDESLMRFNSALALITKEQDPLVNFQLQLGLADLFRSQGRWDVALKHLDIALSEAEEMQSKALQAQVLHSLGKLHRSRYAWDTAIYYYERSALLREEIDDRLGQAQSLHSLGNVCLRASRLEEAEVALQRSLTIKEEIGDKFGIAKSYYGIGHIKRLRGELENALEYYQQSLHLLKEVRNHVKASRVMCRIGMTLAALNRTGEAIAFLEASRDTRQKSNDPQGVSETLYELGLVHERSGDIPTAQESFFLSFKFAKNSKSFTKQLAPMIELAVLAYREGDSKSGAEHLLLARQIATQSKQHILLAHLYAERARTEAEANRLTTAFLCYAEAVYAATDENYEIASTMFHDLVSLLEQVENSAGKLIAEDFSYRLLEFWKKNCEAPRKEVRVWSKLVSPDVSITSQNKGAALSYLKRLQLEFASTEVNTGRR
jgi:tetratricopeptide (TPR) repeat protein